MKRFLAGQVSYSVGKLTRIEGSIEDKGVESDRLGPDIMVYVPEIGEVMLSLQDVFPFTSIMGTRVQSLNTYGDLRQWLREVNNRLQDEMNASTYFQIDPMKANLYECPDAFGEAVVSRFPSASFDIAEAGNCLALERWTGAMFHLGRIAEIAMVTIARSVGYNSPKEGFGEALRYMDNKLKQARENYQKADPKFVRRIDFLSTATAYMHAVNQAWRQRVAHMDMKYTEEEAFRVWNATKGLMEHLATQLQEEGWS